jgi:hypothetical protein
MKPRSREILLAVAYHLCARALVIETNILTYLQKTECSVLGL